MLDGGRARCVCSLIRNLVLAAFLYAGLYAVIQLAQNPSARAKAKATLPGFRSGAATPDVVQTDKSGHVKVKLVGATKSITINPHANVFNRPSSAVQPRDDYLGSRPHVDTEANLPMLVEECRGTYAGIEKMRNVFDCLQFLAHGEERYYGLPEPVDRASEQDPRHAEYNDADGHGNTLTNYVAVSKATAASESSVGTCPGPIIPYHVYWTGPATWRVEVFIKSYLYTQNLACSRLWMWLDADHHPNAVDDMLNEDPLFARFLPFVERGDIRVMAWNFPSRIPVPKREDNTDGVGYYKAPGKPNARGETVVADGIVEDSDGQQWLQLTPKQMTFLPVAVSDAVRFVVLHLHGGAYFDMDVLMLRDMRPLLLPRKHSFAERWAAHPHPGDYNTAIMSLTANSSLSSYLLRGGVRMGLNFHPRVIGRMAWKDGRDQEFLMLETAAFDPIWTEFNWDRDGRCIVPCLRDYGAAFKGKTLALKDEWESYDGEQLKHIDEASTHTARETEKPAAASGLIADEPHETKQPLVPQRRKRGVIVQADAPDHLSITAMAEPLDSFTTTDEEEAALRKAGIVADYVIEGDKYAPNNRTLENFFRGAWTYHVHNQWLKHPEPSSWLDVIQQAHNGFFARSRTNMYGEKWTGPDIMPYNRWPELV
ncbi:hypothetical protein LTR66_001270 [Elasticomyces elasticus]|nr:hypothetical protein LTR66_001270 [Elasticomyces elasticus]